MKVEVWNWKKGEPLEIEAKHVFGHMAVHRGTLFEDTWTVSHLPTGASCYVGIENEQEALILAKAMDSIPGAGTGIQGDANSIERTAFSEMGRVLEKWLTDKKERNLPPDFNSYGSVSKGSTRPEDLIPVFIGVMRKTNGGELYQDHRQILSETDDLIDSYYEHQWNLEFTAEGMEMLQSVLKDVLKWMEELAPEDYYFGLKPGSSDDYGYWIKQEVVE